MKTPWINYREMKEISSRQKVFINFNYQIKPKKTIDHASQLDSTRDISNSPNADFINNHLAIEKEDETSLEANQNPNSELLHSPEFDVEDEMKELLEIEEVNESNPEEEEDLAANLDPDSKLPTASEVDEMKEPLEIKGAAESSPGEEENLAVHLDPNSKLLIPSEVDEMKELLDVKEVDESSPEEEEEDLAVHLDPNSKLSIPSEVDEMKELLDTEVGTNSEEEEDLAANQNPNSKLLIPPEVDEKKELLDTEVGTNSEEENLAAQPDSDREFFSPSEFDVDAEMMRPIDTEEMEKNNSAGHHVSVSTGSVQGEVCSITKKCLISTHVEIDDFLHAPICGEVVKNTFDFLDLNNQLTPQFETKLFNTSTDYPEQPDCRLVHSKINEFIFLMKNDTYAKNKQTSNPSKSVVVPLHNTQSIKKGETNNHSYASDDVMHIRVPVVVGEYKIEVCLEEFIEFNKGILGVKDISNEVVLTKCRFVPTQISQSLNNGTCKALKGKLFIEGFINQNIEYTTFRTTNAVPAQNESLIHSNQLCQNIVLELIIHMLQVQKIRVRYDSQESRG